MTFPSNVIVRNKRSLSLLRTITELRHISIIEQKKRALSRERNFVVVFEMYVSRRKKRKTAMNVRLSTTASASWQVKDLIRFASAGKVSAKAATASSANELLLFCLIGRRPQLDTRFDVQIPPRAAHALLNFFSVVVGS